MRSKWFAAGLLAAAGVLAWVVPSRAGDTVRLNRVDNTPTQNLVGDGRGADTIKAFHRGFGGFGGYRGFGGFGGYRGFGLGGFGRGFGYGGFGRGFGLGYGGFGRGFGYGGYGFGRGFGYGLGLGYGLGGFGYGSYYPGFGIGSWGYGGYYPGFGIGSWGYGGYYPGFFGCSGVTGSVYTLATPAYVTPPAGYVQPGYAAPNPPQMPRDDGTYPYNGGPTTPVPDPNVAPAPIGAPQRTVPLEGRSVSLPKPASKWTYPAYGETARRTSNVEERTFYTKGTPSSGRTR